MKITFKRIKEDNSDTTYLFEDIQKNWEQRGGTSDLAELLKQKAFYEKKYHVETFIMYDNENPVGITWFELTTKSYGNVSMHVLSDKYAPNMVEFLVAKNLFNNRMIEVVSIEDSAIFKDEFYKKNLIANIRQRMSLWLNTDHYYHEEDHPFTFKQYKEEDLEWAAKLSLESHKISKDYKMYDEMNSLERRIELEKRVWSKWYGELINPASIVIFHNDKPVGYSLVIDVKCWGYEHVPWVFDICIEPSFHGQGIGKVLSHRYLNTLIDLDYPLMGLAVTLSNTYAKSLYEKCGFQMVDIFYEFTHRS
tara:strand:- start:5 stop:925 length:921 start_codon:yes stop_codon:yes gene_type:complete